MKILAFTDIHGNKAAVNKIIELAKKENPDILITGGDISNFGRDYNYVVETLDKLGKIILFVPGNHEEGLDNNSLLEKTENWINVDMAIYELKHAIFIGYGGGGFSRSDYNFDDFMKNIKKEIKKNKTLVLITHGPPYGCSLDLVANEHIGNKTYRSWIEKISFKYAISGHLHENFGVIDKIKNTVCINPGPFGIIISI